MQDLFLPCDTRTSLKIASLTEACAVEQPWCPKKVPWPCKLTMARKATPVAALHRLLKGQSAFTMTSLPVTLREPINA